jgi:hypothetical protein
VGWWFWGTATCTAGHHARVHSGARVDPGMVDWSEAAQSRAQRTARTHSRHGNGVTRRFHAETVSSEGHQLIQSSKQTPRTKTCEPGTTAQAKRHAVDVSTMRQRCANDASGVVEQLGNELEVKSDHCKAKPFHATPFSGAARSQAMVDMLKSRLGATEAHDRSKRACQENANWTKTSA